MQTLDVVIPIFNEHENLPELKRRLFAACGGVADLSWRVIYADDGSTDGSHEIMAGQHREDPRFGFVALSRNFGHQAAISAGLDHAHGDAVVVMDGDLQDPPEVIPALVAAWRDGGEVVRAVRRSRRDRGLRRVGFNLFHRFFRRLSDFPVPSDAGVFGLLDRRAVRALRGLRERNRFIPGLEAWIGFRQRVVYYDRDERAAGRPKQSLTRLVRYAADAVFSFSYKPLRLMTWLGVVVSGVGFALAGVFVFKRLIGIETAQTGFTTLVTLVLALSGINLMALGLIGEYLGRIFDEVKRRPLYVLRQTAGVHPRRRGRRGRASGEDHIDSGGVAGRGGGDDL